MRDAQKEELKPLLLQLRRKPMRWSPPGWVLVLGALGLTGLVTREAWSFASRLNTLSDRPELSSTKAFLAGPALAPAALESGVSTVSSAVSRGGAVRDAVPPVKPALDATPLERKLLATASVWLSAGVGVETDAQGVKTWTDANGNVARRYVTTSHVFQYVPPELGYVGRHPALAFRHGSEDVTGLVLEGISLPQPFTLLVVANPDGDATMLSNSASQAMRIGDDTWPHVALCHGWSKRGNAHPRVVVTANGRGPDPLDPPEKLVYGQTRDTKAWHVYTAVVDGPRSQVFVDGLLEGRGDPGPNPLHGLTLGAQPLGQFGMRGDILEVWAWPGVVPAPDHQELAKALRAKYPDAFHD